MYIYISNNDMKLHDSKASVKWHFCNIATQFLVLDIKINMQKVIMVDTRQDCAFPRT